MGERYTGVSTHATRSVKYSSSHGGWVFHDKNAYLYEEGYHKNMVANYSVDPASIRKVEKNPDRNKNISIDNNNVMHVMKNDGSYSIFILMSDGKSRFNVEADFYKINGIDYGYAKKTGMENRLVRLNRGGYYFESRSTRINHSLATVIEDYNEKRYAVSENFHVSNIMADGFCYDDNHHRYLKYENGYYKVERDDEDCDFINLRRDENIEKVYIKKNEEGFFDIDPGFSYTEMNRRFIKSTENYFIERELSIQIQKNSVLHDMDEESVNINDFDYYFSLNGRLYEIAEHNENVVTLKSKYANVPDISIYGVNGFLFESKAKKINTKDFLDIIPSACKIRRSPTESSCTTMVISQQADSLLRIKAKKGTVELGFAERDFQAVNFFPNAFKHVQTNKLYFKYDGHFYRADVTNGIEANVLRQTTLHVYYKGLFGGRKKIVSLVCDDIDGKKVIQTQEEKLQWQAGMTPRECIDFINDNGFLKVPYFGKLEDVVAEVNKKENLKFIILSNSQLHFDMKEKAKDALGYPDYNFEFYSMEDVSDTDPLYLRGGALMIKNAIKHANEQINVAVKELRNFTPNAQKYISHALDTNDRKVILSFSKELRMRFESVNDKINEGNIKLISKNREAISSDHFEKDAVRDSDMLLVPPESENYFHRAGLPERSRQQGVFAFVPYDSSRNIYICLDRLYFIDPSHPDVSLRKNRILDVTETLIHEATHSAGVDPDMTYISFDDGSLAPILDAIDEYAASIVRDELVDKDTFVKIRNGYIGMHPEYSTLADSMQDDNNNILYYLFSHDIGFKANILLNTPDFFAIFARDLAANSAVRLRAR